MKKSLFALSLLSFILLLTSCEVHNMGKSYQVHWYVIAILVAAFSLICLMASHLYITHKTYRCPKCGTEFKPKWNEISSWIHVNDKRVMRCPKCGIKGFCRKID